jgi:hypothetical protein
LSSTALLKKNQIDDDWLENVKCFREDHQGSYTLFCDHALSHVVGRDVWKRRSATHDVSDIATASDEAFALFLIDNSWEVWKAEIEASDAAQVPHPKYSVRGPGTKKFQGWTDEGIKKFNEYYDEVEADRAKDAGNFEKEYKERRLGELNGKKKRKRPTAKLPEEAQVLRARIAPNCADLSNVRKVHV